MKNSHVDIVVITILHIEATAVKAALNADPSGSWKGLNAIDGDSCLVVTRQSHNGEPLVLALVNAAQQGNTHMAVLVENVIRELHPKLVILVGIAAGIINDNKIGDVLVPRFILDFTLSRRSQSKAVGGPVEIDFVEKVRDLESIVKTCVKVQLSTIEMAGIERKCGQIVKAIGAVLPTPDEIRNLDTDADPSDWVKRHVATTNFSLHDNCLASSDVLVRDANLLADIERRNRGVGVRGADMESAGLYWGCRSTNTPWLVIRGISDFGDKTKSDGFQPLASARAAAYCDFFISSCFNRSQFAAAMSWNNRRIERLRALSATVTDVFRGYVNVIDHVHCDKTNISIYWLGTDKVESKCHLVAWRSIPGTPPDLTFSVRGNLFMSVNSNNYLKIANGRSLVAQVIRAPKDGLKYTDEQQALGKSGLQWVCVAPLHDRTNGATLVGVICITSKGQDVSSQDLSKRKLHAKSIMSLASYLKGVVEPIVSRFETRKWTTDLVEGVIREEFI